MSALTLSEPDELYVELLSQLLGRASGILESLTITFQATPQTGTNNERISLIPKVTASRDPYETFRCFQIARSAFEAVEERNAVEDEDSQPTQKPSTDE